MSLSSLLSSNYIYIYVCVAIVFILSRTEEPTKAGTCARDRRALQQLALNVHVKHSDLTYSVSSSLPL